MLIVTNPTNGSTIAELPQDTHQSAVAKFRVARSVGPSSASPRRWPAA